MSSLKFINWIKLTFWTLLAVTAAYYVIISNTVELEQQMQNSITVYEQTLTVAAALSEVTNHYSSLWEDNENVADISENKWIEILLVDNWKELYKPEQVKVYSLETKNCKLINEAFDKLHKQG